MVKKIVGTVRQTRFDRARFFKFDDSALSFEVVYYVKTGDYNKYMDIHQQIHFGIKEAFEKEGIVMAYPTRTIYLEKTS